MIHIQDYTGDVGGCTWLYVSQQLGKSGLIGHVHNLRKPHIGMYTMSWKVRQHIVVIPAYVCFITLTKLFIYSNGTDCMSGTRFLETRGYETSTEWLWYDQVALAAMIVFFLSLAYINLRMVKKEK